MMRRAVLRLRLSARKSTLCHGPAAHPGLIQSVAGRECGAGLAAAAWMFSDWSPGEIHIQRRPGDRC